MNKFILSFFCMTSLFIAHNVRAETGHKIITMNDALRVTLQSDDDIHAARQRLEITKEQYSQALANWRPSVQAEASVYKSDIDNSNFAGADGSTTKDMSLSVDQPIWRGGRSFFQMDEAKYNIKAAEALFQTEVQDILYQTALSYADVYFSREMKRLYTQNKDILDKQYNIASERQEIGDLTQTDVLLAQTRRQRAIADLTAAAYELDIDVREFDERTGLQINPENVEWNFDLMTQGKNLPDNIDELFLDIENSNPEILYAYYRELAAQKSKDEVGRELFPQIGAFASYNKQYDPQPGLVDDSSTATIGLRGTLSLYQGGATRSRIRAAKKEAKQRIHEWQSVKSDMRERASMLWQRFHAARVEYESRLAEVSLARQAADGVKEEALLGQRSTIDVLDADRDYIEAEMSAIQSQRRAVDAYFALGAMLNKIKPSRTDIALR
ncbi:MAG: hypothetical protein CMH32_04065 [Micavibrio sp.]|nr:hypothetical protein [Micavibrio sp.]HCK32752.1 hypothetical protein [Rhodospirillaceae bacterium]|tara:strand:- start:462 stop:1784 length:1323 start_codon:yes stop_codon:yes gene_type:complete